jgi:hypothetical protein
MSRQTLWEWRLTPGFRPWLHDRLKQTSDDSWFLILRRHELLAIAGSVRSAEFILKARALALQAAAEQAAQGAGDPAPNYTVTILGTPSAGTPVFGRRTDRTGGQSDMAQRRKKI